MTRNFIYIVAFFMLATLCCCDCGEEDNDVLTRIDSMADTNPRRALAMLDSIAKFMSGRSEAERSYYSLLRIKAEDKAFVVHKTDTSVLRLVDYYETEGDKRLLPTAYYYAGRVYSDLNDSPRAINYFQKTVDLTDGSDARRYKAYAQMGYVFIYQGLYDKGINVFYKVYEYNKRQDNKDGQTNALCGIACCYQRSGRIDKALYMFCKALKMSKSLNNKSREADILSQIAYCYYHKGQYDIALKYIDKALAGVDPVSLRPVYSIAIRIFEKTGKRDSAIALSKKIYDIDDIYSKSNSCKRLANYYVQLRDADKALRYVSEYEMCLDSIQKIKETETVARIDAVYNYTAKEKENIELKHKISESRYIVASVLLVTLVIVLYLKKKRLKERGRIENEKRYFKSKYESSKAFIEENNRKIDCLNIALNEAKCKNESLVAELNASKEQLENLNKIANINEANRQLAEIGLEKSDICNKIFMILNDNTVSDRIKKMPKDYWNLLDVEVNRYFNGFKDSLMSLCRISEHEYRVCLLLKIGVRPKDISILTNKSKNAISSTRKRLYMKAFGQNVEPERWDEFIRSL